MHCHVGGLENELFLLEMLLLLHTLTSLVSSGVSCLLENES